MAVINLNNAPGAVPYVSMTDDQSNAVLINALNERTKQYENQLNAIAENEALLRQMKVRDADRAGSLVRAAKIASELDKEIQEKYAGDYASVGARKAVVSRLTQERGTFATLQQKYEEEQPYKQMYQQLKMTGQLAQKYNPATRKIEEVNPFAQSIVDVEGNLISQTGIDYGDIRKKGDYIDYVSRNIVDPLNKRMKDLGLRYTQGPFYGTKTSIQRTKVGMSPEEAASTIDDVTAKRFLEDNPNYAFEFGSDLEKTKDFIKGIVRDKVIEQIHPNYGNVTDPLAALKYKESKIKQQPPYDPFMALGKERGEKNPFMIARQKEGKTLEGVLKSSTGLIGNKYKDSNEAIKLMSEELKRQREIVKKGTSLYGSSEEAKQAGLRQMQLEGALKELNKYHKEVTERKSNWFNHEAQSITGDINARYATLSPTQKSKIRALAPKTEAGWARTFDADLEGNSLTVRNLRPIDPDLQKYISKSIDFSGNYFRSSEGGTQSKNIDDVAKDAGIDPLVLKEAIKSGAFTSRRLDATGEYAVRIPKDLKINAQGKLDYDKAKDNKSVTLYYTFDNATEALSEPLRWAEMAKYETGQQSKVFNLPVIGEVELKKSKQPNIFYMNGRPITKGWLENFMLDASRAYLTQEYKTRMPAQKLYKSNLEEESE